jgi:hypothetical protein
MSYFAAEGRVSHDAIEGGIEISEQQYQAAIAGMMSGKLVTVEGGFAVIDPPEPEPEPKPEPQPVDLVAYAAQKRWEVETGGIMVAGVPVATDDRSKIMIIGARVKADADANFTTQWKLPSGDFLTIDAATLIAISDAVLAHVDACFAVEATVLAGIAAGTITTTANIDAAAWPA